MDSDEFDPSEVALIIAQALADKTILPLSFVETKLFDKLNSLLVRYHSQADTTYIISELKNEFLGGFTKMSSSQLHGIIHHCVQCESLPHPPVLPSWNTVDPDMMIVVENPSKTVHFMPFLKSSLKDAGFSSQRCMLTYMSRCVVDKPTATTIKSCLPYLHTEMAVIKPKLILTLGLSCYAAITGDGGSQLNDIRGSILWFGPYAVLPEASLGAGSYAQQKNQGLQSYLTGPLGTAYTFLYGSESRNKPDENH